MGKELAGGRSYIKIDWSIPDVTNGKGSLLPIGIAALDKLPKNEAIAVPRLKEGVDMAAVASSVQAGDFRALGVLKFAFAWNKDALYIVLEKKAMPGDVRFAFDGKNGKNAFLSFADRVVMYQPDKDSLRETHFSRVMAGDTLKYNQKAWPNELTKSASGDKTIIRVPWYDVGIIPFEERRMGMGIMAFDAKGQQTAALPPKADFFLPGTWCDLLLAK
jgi:hypothetical protein